MKKLSQVVFLVLMLALMISPAVTIPLIRQDGTAEKRTLASFPSLIADGRFNTAFPSQFESWLNDHVGLRTIWQQQYAQLNGALGASANDSVIIGEDGWLFFDSTVADYTGVDSLTENQLWRVKYTLEAIDRQLDVPFFVMFAPNKSSVYPEYMPARYPVNEGPRPAQWLLENCTASLIDIEAALTGDDLYFRTDTHWNEKGARIAAGLIIERLNEAAGISASAPDPYSEYTLEPWEGDLGVMLYPGNPPEDVHMVYADGGQRYEYEGRYRTQEDMTITTSGGETEFSLLMLRDSFTNALIEPLSNALANVQYRRAMPLPLSDAGKYDAVLLEMVERRIYELLDAAPVLFAEECAGWSSAEPNCTALVYAEEKSGGVRLFGELSAPVDRITSLTVSVTSGGETHFYEAFPCAENSLTGGDGAFSLLLTEMAADAVIQVRMAGESGEALSAPASAEWLE